MWGTLKLFGIFSALFLVAESNERDSVKSDFRKGWHSKSDVGSSIYAPPHPLDPLTEAEMNRTASIVRNLIGSGFVFNYITLKEPEKHLLLSYFLEDKHPPPGFIPRKAFVILLNRATQRTYEVTVNLDRGQVEKWSSTPDGVQPPITPDEMMEAEQIMRANQTVIELCRNRGWTNMSLVFGDQWTIGYAEDRPEYRGKRLLQLYLHGKNFPEDNLYAHPFDFLPIVDLNEGRVINVEDLPTHDDFDATNKVGNVVPRATSNYAAELRDPSSFRQDLKPLHISQPEGASFTIKGNEIHWQKYKMRIGFNGREGFVIYHVSYKDGAETRPLFYRMSLVELFIPYGDPRPPYHRVNVFDEGQYGNGYLMFPLDPGLDCIGESYFFDGVLNNEKGEAVTNPRLACVTEEDAGLLWKHTDFRTGRNSAVRARRLAIMSSAAMGNYDYVYMWYFYQDGTIEFTVKLTGIVNINLLAVNATPGDYGTAVFPQLNAQYHQHFFSVRVDPEIDGNRNSVAMVDVVPLESPTGSPGNPYGQGFTTKTKIFQTVAGARSNKAPRKSRTWQVLNRERLNPYNKRPVAYKMMPWQGPPLLMKMDSPIREQVRWLDFDTWVTPYSDEEMFPGGYYLNNSGLHEWIERDPKRNVENEDVVLWHSFGMSHVPRTEDFPVMPLETCGVTFKPVNFFKENPALDVPPSPRYRQR